MSDQNTSNIMRECEITNYQCELLTILMEECGETVQEVCKLLRFGINGYSHHPGKESMTRIDCLEQEIGDMLALVKLLKESKIGITDDGLNKAMERKLEKLPKWMTNKPTSVYHNRSDVTAGYAPLYPPTTSLTQY